MVLSTRPELPAPLPSSRASRSPRLPEHPPNTCSFVCRHPMFPSLHSPRAPSAEQQRPPFGPTSQRPTGVYRDRNQPTIRRQAGYAPRGLHAPTSPLAPSSRAPRPRSRALLLGRAFPRYCRTGPRPLQLGPCPATPGNLILEQAARGAPLTYLAWLAAQGTWPRSPPWGRGSCRRASAAAPPGGKCRPHPIAAPTAVAGRLLWMCEQMANRPPPPPALARPRAENLAACHHRASPNRTWQQTTPRRAAGLRPHDYTALLRTRTIRY